MKEKHKVGYKNPPLHTRFQKGNTAHLNRRKKTDHKEGALFRELMEDVVPISIRNKTQYRSRMQVIIDNLVAPALGGDLSAAEDLILLHENFEEMGDMSRTVLMFSYADSLLL